MLRGRFAPTPSGPLHAGSMVAAVGSYLDAKSRNGEWLLRIDDLDAPRVAPGAADAILRCLEGFGLHWDGPVMFQSRRGDAYRAAVERLRADGLVFECACSRREVEQAGLPGIDGPVYPGTCSAGLPPGRTMRSLRMRVGHACIEFQDALQGRMHQDLGAEVGDFVLWRTEGVYAYHLACAVDDAAQGITEVVRGADLIDSTPRQIYLQQCLGLPTPGYLHLPVATHAAGEKLSKQTLAPAVAPGQEAAVLAQVLAFLGHLPPPQARGSAAELLAWATSHWDRARLPRRAGAPWPAG
ncbi:MAG TPA: tRNA glutamyl-Q(34) synthetase GluQRS [Burkholderiales bacterium]|jgi:glutamyl-Q tRNA(Asp) synthetase|nr:tRNA glutamyl-Q(34) synthetase GluQRS [Burkholderiales bacterium]